MFNYKMFKGIIFAFLLQPGLSFSGSSDCSLPFSKVPTTKITLPDNINYNNYKGQEGFIDFSNEYFDGNMQKAFKAVSKAVIMRLGWRTFWGTTKDFLDYRNTILDAEGNIHKGFYGKEGFARLIEQHFQGARYKARLNTRSVLGREKYEGLGWL